MACTLSGSGCTSLCPATCPINLTDGTEKTLLALQGNAGLLKSLQYTMKALVMLLLSATEH